MTTGFTRLLLLLVAAVIGFTVVAGESVLYSALTGRPWTVSGDFDLWTVAIVATPYVVLAVLPATRLAPWAVALALTISLWGWWLYSTVNYYRHPDGSGADIGTGILLIASPLVISVVAAAVHFALEDATQPRSLSDA